MTPAIVVIGTSLGGFRALPAVLDRLPASLTIPVAVVQHRPAAPGDEFVAHLRSVCMLPVREVEDKDPLAPGIHLAPADYHLLVERDHFALSTEGPVQHARPSVDVLLASAAAALGGAVLAVILTGRGQDGARGALAVLEHGGEVIVQDPKDAEEAPMPRAAIAAARGAARLALARIGPEIARRCGAGQ